jgi:DNA-binding PadR family transcriptional regulator
MTELLVLAILLKEKCTIYKIRQKIRESFSIFLGASFGSIHPALKKLEENGHVKVSKKMSSNGQKSSIYSITDSGKKYFEELMLADITESTLYASQLINIKIMLLEKIEKSMHQKILANIKRFYEINILNTDAILQKTEKSEENLFKITVLKHYIQKNKDEISWLKSI